MKKTTLGVIAIMAFFNLNAQKNAAYIAYIEQYSEIAMVEQARHKIPASITLAQALLESGAGKSQLAQESNNHFGIKCHSNWEGEKVYHDDDQKGECFRKYDKVIESYEDHSAFLKRDRYQTLFTYKITDYKSWAYGLKAAGYATDPKYPSKLIKIIEDYELNRFDDPQKVALVAQNFDKDVEERIARQQESKSEEVVNVAAMSFAERNMYPIHEVKKTNGVKFVIARQNDTFDNIAQEFGITKRELIRYNDLPKDTTICAGMQLYVQPKQSKSKTKIYKHVVDYGDSMHSISQQYGIKMRKLYKLNNLKKWVPAEYGMTLKLR